LAAYIVTSVILLGYLITLWLRAKNLWQETPPDRVRSGGSSSEHA
jgi:hypothetical protein